VDFSPFHAAGLKAKNPGYIRFFLLVRDWKKQLPALSEIESLQHREELIDVQHLSPDIMIA
jgi:hypothetical protein